MVLGANSNALV